MVNDVRTELFYDGEWNNISTDVRQADPITVKWGRANEAAQVSPSSCSLTLESQDGKYVPDHPLSPLYGKIDRNTPLRVKLGTKSVSLELPGADGSYVSTPDAAALDITGDIDIRAEINPYDWRPDFGEGDRMHIASKYLVEDDQRSWAFKLDEEGTLSLRTTPDGTTQILHTSTAAVPDEDVWLWVRVTLDVNNGASGHDVKFYTSTDGVTWTQLGATVTVAGTTSVFSSTADLTIGSTGNGDSFGPGENFRGQVRAFQLYNGIGGTLVANPDFTAAEAGDTTLTDATGKVWTLHGAAAFTDTSIRFSGEVSSWPIDWDLSGADVRVSVDAAGIRRRLGQGEKPLRSSLFRDLSTKDNIVAYWPMEDGKDTTVFGEVESRDGGLNIIGDVTPAAYTDLDASDGIPTFRIGRAQGNVGRYTPDSDQRIMAVINVPEDGITSASADLLNFDTNNGAHSWTLRIDNTGALKVLAWDDDQNLILDSGWLGFAINGQRGLVWLLLRDIGPSIDWQVGFHEVGVTAPGVVDGNLWGYSYGRLTRIRVGAFVSDFGGMAIGHVSIMNGDVDGEFWNTASNSLIAWSGETAGERIIRLCTEEDIPIRVLADVPATEPVGPQRIDTLLNLLDEAAEADMGILCDDRDALRLVFRGRTELYSQAVSLSLDYSAGEVAEKLQPVPDDQLTRNDVTVKRPNGGSYRAVLETGPMSVAAVGRYDTEPEVNVAADSQLKAQANWRLHLGTVNEPRYPQITADLTAAPGKATDAMAVFVGNRVQVTNPPAWLPPNTIDQLAQGGTEKLTPYRHTIAYNCSPASPWTVVVVGETKVDTAGSELSSSATDSATSLSVATTVGETWTTDAAQFPFDVELGGEVVTVTAIGAPVGNVQTFTVTRSTNGISKAHSAGTAVRLAPKYRAAVGL